MKKLILPLIGSALLAACGKSDVSEGRQRNKVTAEQIESRVVVSGQEYVTTIGTQQASGPYQDWGSIGGGKGLSVHFQNLTFTVPDDGRQYIARRFKNPDGSGFMKISKYPVRAERPKNEG